MTKQETEEVRKEKKMNEDKGVLIYKDQQPYKTVQNIADASKLTKIPYCTIRRMIINPVLSDKDKRNGGRTAPNGWGFDYLA